MLVHVVHKEWCLQVSAAVRRRKQVDGLKLLQRSKHYKPEHHSPQCLARNGTVLFEEEYGFIYPQATCHHGWIFEAVTLQTDKSSCITILGVTDAPDCTGLGVLSFKPYRRQTEVKHLGVSCITHPHQRTSIKIHL